MGFIFNQQIGTKLMSDTTRQQRLIKKCAFDVFELNYQSLNSTLVFLIQKMINMFAPMKI